MNTPQPLMAILLLLVSTLSVRADILTDILAGGTFCFEAGKRVPDEPDWDDRFKPDLHYRLTVYPDTNGRFFPVYGEAEDVAGQQRAPLYGYALPLIQREKLISIDFSLQLSNRNIYSATHTLNISSSYSTPQMITYNRLETPAADGADYAVEVSKYSSLRYVQQIACSGENLSAPGVSVAQLDRLGKYCFALHDGSDTPEKLLLLAYIGQDRHFPVLGRHIAADGTPAPVHGNAISTDSTVTVSLSMSNVDFYSRVYTLRLDLAENLAGTYHALNHAAIKGMDLYDPNPRYRISTANGNVEQVMCDALLPDL